MVSQAHVSAITRAEVLSDVDSARSGPVRMLLDAFSLVAIDRAVADLATELRRTYRWRLPDAYRA